MRFISLIALLAVIVWPLTNPSQVSACSVGPDFNPVESSEVIVKGTVVRWEEVSSPSGPGIYQPIRLTIQVDSILKGEPAQVLYVYDVASLIRRDQGPIGGTWGGSGGACGAFDFDPTGKYVVLGLWRSDDGALQSVRPQTFFIGDRSELTSKREAAMLERLSGFGLIVPPSTGTGGLR